MIDFIDKHPPIGKLRLPQTDWAIVRGDSKIVVANGLFNTNPFIATSVIDDKVSVPNMGNFILSSMPVTPPHSLEFDAIPQLVLNKVSELTKQDQFLRASKKRTNNREIYDVKLFKENTIISYEIYGNGTIIEIDKERLPETLPDHITDSILPEFTNQKVKIIHWQIYNNYLIAIIEGTLSSGKKVTLAINRLGERFSLSENLIIDNYYPESRLWLVATYDIGADKHKVYAFGRALLFGGLFMWFLFIFLAGFVSKRTLKRVDLIVDQAEKIMPYNLEDRLPIGQTNDELSRISLTINNMLDRVKNGYDREKQFTSDVSHELRNPLAKVLAEIDLALSKNRNEQEYQQALKRLNNYAVSMQKIIDSLLMLARLDSSENTLVSEPFDITQNIIDTIQKFSEDKLKRLDVKISISDSPLIIIGHPHLISIMIRNLLDNALEHSPEESPVLIQVRINDDYVSVSVSDEGPGIPDEEVSLAFNRFYQINKTSNYKNKGVGLGLAIVKAISDLHNIPIEISKGTPKGTIVRFQIPLYTTDTI